MRLTWGERKEMSDGFIRQRRNLFIISALILLLHESGFTIDKVTILGVSLGNLDNPGIIYNSIWLLFIYFIIRCYQYFIYDGWASLTGHFKSGCDECVRDWCKSMNVKVLVWDSTNGVHVETTPSFPKFSELREKDYEWIVESTPQGYKTFYFDPSLRSRAYLFSIFSVITHSTYFTDYVLPFIFAFFVMINSFTGSDISFTTVFF